MKKSTFAILLTTLITLSCVFAACNTGSALPYPSDQSTASDTTDSNGNYSTIIKELEDQILELKQDQYISEAKRAQEIARLEALILELKQSDGNNETTDHKDTSSATASAEDEKNESSESESGSETDAVTSPAGIFTYEVTDGKASITGFTGSDSSITIPSSIDGYEVTCIADDAFQSETLKNVTIPDGVTKIGWFAFKECPALRTVTIPNSVSSIRYSAFPANHKGFSIICHTDSFAATYAQSYGISMTAI